ncbi:hypothetical protein SNE40_013596 [Patella caerulea]|uniref:Alkaline phosphatase n=1 Tax=Patella caerulea TaxID=87958 RepID=A0AAN8JJM8_PATCE
MPFNQKDIEIISAKNFWLNSGRASIEESLRVRNIVEKAKNVIIFIGDGMSIPTITASRILKGQSANHPGEETIMSWEKFPHVGLAKTYNVDSQVPDSAGTGTAFLSGVKTRKGMINVDASVSRGDCSASQGHELDTILRWSLDEGKSAGVVTTTRITHATPAASYASVADRGWEGDNEMSSVHGGCKDIAKQLVEDNKDIQVLMGGGRHYFYPNGHKDPENGHNGQRQDGRNLIEEWQKEKATRGVSAKFVWNSTDLSHVDPASTDYLLGK